MSAVMMSSLILCSGFSSGYQAMRHQYYHRQLEIRTNLRLGVSIVMIATFCKSYANQKQPGLLKKPWPS